jgi:carbon storage regulator
MLVMARRSGESILIGDEIEIVIAHIGRTRVKVGIRAPRRMPVIARETKLVRDENVAAATAGPGALAGLLTRLRSAQVSANAAEEKVDRQDAGTEN